MKFRLTAVSLLSATLCILLLGCSNSPTVAEPTEDQPVVQVGQIPSAFKEVIEYNTFAGITAFQDRLLKSNIINADTENRTISYHIQMMDLYGKSLAEYTCEADDAYHVTTLTATDDGGFLFVLGFRDRAYSQDVWASDQGFASRIIKCDRQGNLEFDTALESVAGMALPYCFEKNGQFYFFGKMETPETKRRGVGSPTDISMTILDKTGAVLKQEWIGGSDFDSLDAAELTDTGFLLSVSAQSDDGDFAGSNSKGYPKDWVIKVNDQLEITEKKQESGREFSDERIGQRNGVSVYSSDPLLSDFNAGRPEAFIDYGDFYMIVSENVTGTYEHPPIGISRSWNYTETVYSAYDHNDQLLFRTSVDSSPDYDAMAKSITESTKSVSIDEVS
jgi:hypothetical protein